MAVGYNYGVYDYIRTDDNEYPEIIITPNDEYVGTRCAGIRTYRHSSYRTMKAGIGQG